MSQENGHPNDINNEALFCNRPSDNFTQTKRMVHRHIPADENCIGWSGGNMTMGNGSRRRHRHGEEKLNPLFTGRTLRRQFSCFSR
jgi:hypothetical protein